MIGVTRVKDMLVVRFIGLQAEHARARLTRAWEVLRPRRLGMAAQRPRIWNT